MSEQVTSEQLKEHTWVWTNIGHNTWGNVCSECDVDYITGMSKLGCPGLRLFNEHWLPSGDDKTEHIVKFTIPTEVKTEWVYEGEVDPKNPFRRRRLLKKTFTFVRNDQILCVLEFPGETEAEFQEKKNKEIEGNRLVSVGDRFELDKKSLLGGSIASRTPKFRNEETPFLDFLEKMAQKPTAKDYQLPFYKRPERRVVMEI